MQAYSSTIGNSLIAVPVLLTLFGFIWSVILLRSADITPHYVAGHVLMGLTAICACLIGLVATIVHQTRNTFSVKEHWLWCYCWVIFFADFWLTYHYFWYLRINQFRCKRPPEFVPPGIIASFASGSGMILRYSIFFQSVVVSAGMATHMFVSQQNTHDSGIYLSVLSVPCCVLPRLKLRKPIWYLFVLFRLREFWWDILGAVCFTLCFPSFLY